MTEANEEQKKILAVTSYLIETGKIHAKDAMTGRCIPEICRKCNQR